MKEMSELRRYFENYCQELELRYRNEFEEHLARLASKEGGPGGKEGGSGAAAPPPLLVLPPLNLDVSQGKLDLSELESISPRSMDSSHLNSLGTSYSFFVWHIADTRLELALSVSLPPEETKIHRLYIFSFLKLVDFKCLDKNQNYSVLIIVNLEQ